MSAKVAIIKKSNLCRQLYKYIDKYLHEIDLCSIFAALLKQKKFNININ